jgi:hypothetical protein
MQVPHIRNLNENEMVECFEIWDDSGNFVALVYGEYEDKMDELCKVFNCTENSESPYLIMNESDIEEFNKNHNSLPEPKTVSKKEPETVMSQYCRQCRRWLTMYKFHNLERLICADCQDKRIKDLLNS